MFKFSIIVNEYEESQTLAREINQQLTSHGLVEDVINPDYVFVIGGDGTLLKAVNEFQDIIDEVCFVIIKSGSLGFYANYTKETYSKVIADIANDRCHLKQLPLLEVAYNNNQINYALNEVKVVDHVKTLRTKIFINDELLEYFRGSGLVFATSTGSTGYMRAINGSIITTNKYKLWQLKEIAPVANVRFITINASLILDDSQVIVLEGELIDKRLIIDTFEFALSANELEIKISEKTLNIVYDEDNDLSMTEKMKSLFAHCII
ncbi:hypothetical protein P344_01130 [Spiroplasma mirum ATCC 29335]|uniref:Inorganic polyphosphate/ATP-NAD kinase n=1 Tax=Spiroplasma mirum ATCC 29335 TaxID=838561 RepID=W0GNK7_9MOLU|nr:MULTISPECIES: NAD(+)/NADH kinase [Spiroplasma]AHF60638.1 putative ATP-NAD kinase [Spiroplasma mirum ATCC 29335]AHI57592.1 hypothetical protein P344_01130 [Spiroplasma mirum ATCC 29335]AKM52785.1 inorganic polyphosphate/ATP-NAD kinase [Spiroplasma atrichopogonis]